VGELRREGDNMNTFDNISIRDIPRLERATDKITRFIDSDEWTVDIIETEEWFEAWLGNINYGIKEFMFGLSKETYTAEQFLETVVLNLNKYEDDYVDEYFD
jgi:hypothetical protein